MEVQNSSLDYHVCSNSIKYSYGVVGFSLGTVGSFRVQLVNWAEIKAILSARVSRLMSQ